MSPVFFKIALLGLNTVCFDLQSHLEKIDKYILFPNSHLFTYTYHRILYVKRSRVFLLNLLKKKYYFTCFSSFKFILMYTVSFLFVL